MSRKRDPKDLRVGDKVIAATPIGRIPEGALGVVKLVNGFQWLRYWVAWESGDWIGSIDGDDIVRADYFEQWKQEKAEAALRPKTAAKAETAVATETTGTGGVPEHLLERSRQARARAAAKTA